MLSEKNYQTYQFWRRCKASNFRYMPAHLEKDPIVARNFAALDDLQFQLKESRRNKVLQLLLTGKVSE